MDHIWFKEFMDDNAQALISMYYEGRWVLVTIIIWWLVESKHVLDAIWKIICRNEENPYIKAPLTTKLMSLSRNTRTQILQKNQTLTTKLTSILDIVMTSCTWPQEHQLSFKN